MQQLIYMRRTSTVWRRERLGRTLMAVEAGAQCGPDDGWGGTSVDRRQSVRRRHGPDDGGGGVASRQTRRRSGHAAWI
jgi:hypothetical protein